MNQGIGTLCEKYNSSHRLHIETTKKCNMKCEHCYVSSDNTYTHYELGLLEYVIQRSAQNGAKRITLTGGEFLTRDDWKDIILKAIHCGFRNVYFITNGLNLTRNTLEWLSKTQSRHNLKNALKILTKRERPLTIGFGISLDGIDGYGMIRKNNSGNPIDVNKILDKIKLATNFGLYITINTTVSNATIAKELYTLYKILLNLNIDRWQIDQVFPEGRGGKSSAIEPHSNWFPSAIESYYRIIKDYLSIYPQRTKMMLEIVQLFRTANLVSGFSSERTNLVHPCEYQFGSVIVENGSVVRFCPSLRGTQDNIFNIKESKVNATSYNSNSSFLEFSKLTINDLECNNCRYRFISHGGCRANSLSLEGSIYSKDPICCTLSPFLEEKIIPLFPEQIRNEFAYLIDRSGTVPDS